MAKFAIFTYLFEIIENTTDPELFPMEETVNPQESWNRKQELLASFFAQGPRVELKKNMTSEDTYDNLIEENPLDKDIIILRVANKHNTKLEQGFVDNKMTYSPSVLVLIDNRKDMQRIAIQQSTKSFSDVQTVAKILERSLCAYLRKYRLSVKICPKRHSKDFWKIADQHQTDVVWIRFNLTHPNLPALDDLVCQFDEMAKALNVDPFVGGTALQDQVVTLNRDSQFLCRLVEACAATGQSIHMKTKDNVEFECYVDNDEEGNIVTEDLKSKAINALRDKRESRDMFESPIAKLNEFMYQLKFSYE